MPHQEHYAEKSLCESVLATLQCISFGNDQWSTVVPVAELVLSWQIPI